MGAIAKKKLFSHQSTIIIFLGMLILIPIYTFEQLGTQFSGAIKSVTLS
jgi:hypothetical protein